MQVIINDLEYDIPFDPLVIPLGKYIEYQNAYGKPLMLKLEEALKIENEDEKVLELDNVIDEEAISWFSFWSGVNLFQAKKLPAIMDVISSYKTLRYLLKFNEEDCNFPMEVIWNGEVWKIQDFKVNPASKMSFNEIISSKEISSQIFQIGGNKFDALLYLSVIFFRKLNEPFVDEMLHENSERLNLMKELPLRYAMNLSLFLILCANSSKIISPSLQKEVA